MKPVNDTQFWKKRIDESKHTAEHWSVYVSNPSLWKHIELCHRDIFKAEHVGGKVLDAGCGYGRFAPLFDDYTGVDFSPDFIELAQSKYPDKKFLQANLKELPFADKEFDWAFCVSIKRMIVDNLGEDEWSLMEKELKRVAKKVLILEYETPGVHEVIA